MSGLELIGGAVLGAAVSELLKAVLDAKKKTSSFKSNLTRLESTLNDMMPRLEEITRLNGELEQKQSELQQLLDIINNGKALVLNCSTISSIRLRRKMRYSKQLLELDNSLLRYSSTIMPLVQLKILLEIKQSATILEESTHVHEHTIKVEHNIKVEDPLLFLTILGGIAGFSYGVFKILKRIT